MFNQALLGRWFWQFGVETDSLWGQVIGTKYGVSRRGWFTSMVGGTYGVSLWRYINKGWFSENISSEVGTGQSIRFWLDNWRGDGSFSERFLDLFEIARHRDVLVAEYLGSQMGLLNGIPHSFGHFMIGNMRLWLYSCWSYI